MAQRTRAFAAPSKSRRPREVKNHASSGIAASAGTAFAATRSVCAVSAYSPQRAAAAASAPPSSTASPASHTSAPPCHRLSEIMRLISAPIRIASGGRHGAM